MKGKSIAVAALAALLLISFACKKNNEYQKVASGGPEKIEFAALPFPPGDVKLLDGPYPFTHARDLNIKSLLAYEPDRFLAGFYLEAGLKPKAEKYHGWEDETIAGHSLGHYLSAISRMYIETANPEFLTRVNYIVSELKLLQEHDGNGYIGAFPDGKRILEDEVGKGNIRSKGFDLNGIWVPFYTQHKIFSGLRDAYRMCNNSEALAVAKDLALWLEKVVKPLDNSQVQKMLVCEHGGISETLADLWADTGDSRFLELSRLFYHEAILDPLKEGKDILPGKHCNTNIPKLISLSRLYELTGDTSGRNAAKFFWNTVAGSHSYVTGGNGNNEYFGPAGKLRDRLGEGTTESCNVYNMLKLTSHIFSWDGSANSADFYERALLNHILSTQNPENGRVTYNLSLEMGGFKDFQDPEWFTCCIGTGMENHSKYSDNIFYHSAGNLWLFQYIASTLDWKERKISVVQETSFPEKDFTILRFSMEQSQEFTVFVRWPYWATEGIVVTVNGKKVKTRGTPGSFAEVTRRWNNGDELKVTMPYTLRLEEMPDDSSRVAIMYGPLVMAGDLGPVKDSLSRDPLYVPVLMTAERDPSKWLVASDREPNTFTTVNTGRPRDITLRPFYKFHDRRYTVYWDLFTEENWKKRETDYVASVEKEKRLKENQVDAVAAGEMQPERDHNFRGEKTTPGSFKERMNRESRGGWFSYDLKCDPAKPVFLAVEYWGGFPGAKKFDILADNSLVATENISNKKDGEFITEIYPLKEELTRGKQKLTVMFRAHEGNMAGPVFTVRIVRGVPEK